MRRIAFILALVAGMTLNSDGQKRKYGFNPEKYPEILQEESFASAGNLEKLFGFIDWDFSSKDMRGLSLKFLSLQAFDHRTIWPEKSHFPDNFSPAAWLETGKDPGLGIYDLHKKGVTGKGVAVAVFDKYIIPNHDEFTGRMIFHKIRSPKAKDFQYRFHFHGIACASILCGKNIGIAPDAVLHYFAVPDDGNNSFNYCLALEELLRVNQKLSGPDRIRVISISDGIDLRDEEIKRRWDMLAAQTAEQGIGLVCSNTAFPLLTWGGCPPFMDRNNPNHYDLAEWPKNHDKTALQKIIIPADYRTTAQNDSPNSYVYWGDGGFSWAMPYFAGLAALAWSIAPELTFEDIFQLVEETKTHIPGEMSVVNPSAFIDAVKNK